MPKAARFEIVRLDAAGNPISGAVITPFSQGATVSAGGPTSFTVDDPGSISTASTVLGVSGDGLTERSGTVGVSSTTATNVTTSTGISGMVNNDRIVNNTGINIYKDEQLNEAVGFTVTTDARGYASGYFIHQPFDYKSVGGTSPLGTALTQYWFDVYPLGGSSYISSDFPTGSAVLRRYNNAFALLSGDRFIEYQSAGVNKWYVGLNAALGAVVPAHNVAGLLTIDSGGLGVTAGASALQALTATTGSFSGLLTAQNAITIAAGGMTVTAGDIAAVASLVNSKRLGATGGTAVAAGDFALGAGWGNTATVSNVSAGSNDTKGQIRITCNGSGITANPTLTFTFKDGTYTTTPIMVVGNGTNYTTFSATDFWYCNATVSNATIIWGGTPVATRVYEVNWHMIK